MTPTDGQTKACPRCGRAFLCRGETDIFSCQCAAVPLAPEDHAYIADRFSGCLCADCLRALRDERAGNAESRE